MTDTILYEMRDSCIYEASFLGDYQKISITDLADGYAKAIDDNDDPMMSSYLGALILRWWYRIEKLYEENKMILNTTRDDALDLLVEAINYAMKYRKWQTSNNSAQSCINQCINTIVLQHRYQARLQWKKANYNTLSLNSPCNSDDEDEWIDTLTAEDFSSYGRGNGAVSSLIQDTINDNKVIEAIILDNISYKDNETQKTITITETEEDGTTETYKAKKGMFSKLQLVKNLNTLDSKYLDYFTNKYNIKQEIAEKALAAVNKANNSVLYKYLASSLDYARANFEF